ncbi:MAG: flagellar biosynthesis protein FlhB [Miltoncostaeaceae bacterium]
MAAGATGEKTEKATPKRREEARKRGQVARSQELNTGLGLLTVFAMLAFMGSWMLQGFMAVLESGLAESGQAGSLDSSAAWDSLMAAGLNGLWLTAHFAFGGVLVGVIASAVQVKPGITPEVLKVRFSMISPKNGVKRLFSVRSMVRTVKDLFKIAITGLVAYWVLQGSLDELMSLLGASPGLFLTVIGTMVLKVGFSIAAIYIVIAVADLAYERWQHERDLRMTIDEVRREFKEADLGPEVKAQMKRRQREMSVRRMMNDVPDADVVIVNPTHYAVALKYERAFPAPKVVAKGVDHTAHRIIALAEEHGVTVRREPPLARSLYANSEVGQYIPADAFGAVAEILAVVYRTGRRGAAA